MSFTRRDILAGAALLAGRGSARAAAFDLVYAAGRLSWPGGSTRASVGRAGVRGDKREGDLATPQGDFPLLQAFYRADRVSPAPLSGLPLRALRPDDAWVDDPGDARYNTAVATPYRAHVEPLWRSGARFDLIVVIGYNADPPRAGAGSAIFLHVARETYAPTVGCVAVARPVLLALLPQLSRGSVLHIRP